jgi:hypothetical protein
MVWWESIAALVSYLLFGMSFQECTPEGSDGGKSADIRAFRLVRKLEYLVPGHESAATHPARISVTR